MVRRERDRISIEGSITINNVVALKDQGIALFEGNSLVIDLAGVTEVDSSAISMFFEWLREANREDCELKFINVPENIESLIQLYGVSAFFSSSSI